MKEHLLKIALGALAVFFLGTQFQTPCFEVLQNKSDVPSPIISIMLNKCTGKTWALARTSLTGENGKPTGESSYRWNPLNMEFEEPRWSFNK